MLRKHRYSNHSPKSKEVAKMRCLVKNGEVGGELRKKRECERTKLSMSKVSRELREGNSAPVRADESSLNVVRVEMSNASSSGKHVEAKEVMSRVNKVLGTSERMGKRSKRLKASKAGARSSRTSSWETERVRVGTGYRVRKVEGKERELDLGFGHIRKYTLGPGVELVDVNKSGRKLWADKQEGPQSGCSARERVMRDVVGLERRRPLSVYTGCGRTRKSRVGKKKLKPTKVRVA